MRTRSVSRRRRPVLLLTMVWLFLVRSYRKQPFLGLKQDISGLTQELQRANAACVDDIRRVEDGPVLQAIGACSDKLPGKRDDRQSCLGGDTVQPGVMLVREGLRTILPRLGVKAIAKFRQYVKQVTRLHVCLLYTSPSPRDRTRSRM